MSPSELVPGQIYVVNQNGYRYHAKFLRLGYANSPSGGRFYEFEITGKGRLRNNILKIHERKVEASVEYPRYTQLDLKLV